MAVAAGGYVTGGQTPGNAKTPLIHKEQAAFCYVISIFHYFSGNIVKISCVAMFSCVKSSVFTMGTAANIAK
jgi:hypothetical protein